MANQYMELYNQCYLIQYQLDGLNANCSSCDVNVNTQLAVVSRLQGKLDAALFQDPPADDATLTWYRLELEKEQEADTSSALDKSSASDRAKKPPAGKTEHKQPQKRKRKPKSKETR